MGLFDFLGDLFGRLGGGIGETANAFNTGEGGGFSPETQKILSGLGSALGKAGQAAAGSGTGKYDQAARGLGSLAESLGGGKQQSSLYNKMAGVENQPTPHNVKKFSAKPDGGYSVEYHPSESQLATQQPLTQASPMVPQAPTIPAVPGIQTNMQDAGVSVTPEVPAPFQQTQSALNQPVQNPQMLSQAMGGGQVPFLQALQRLQNLVA